MDVLLMSNIAALLTHVTVLHISAFVYKYHMSLKFDSFRALLII